AAGAAQCRERMASRKSPIDSCKRRTASALPFFVIISPPFISTCQSPPPGPVMWYCMLKSCGTAAPPSFWAAKPAGRSCSKNCSGVTFSGAVCCSAMWSSSSGPGGVFRWRSLLPSLARREQQEPSDLAGRLDERAAGTSDRRRSTPVVEHEGARIVVGWRARPVHGDTLEDGAEAACPQPAVGRLTAHADPGDERRAAAGPGKRLAS